MNFQRMLVMTFFCLVVWCSALSFAEHNHLDTNNVVDSITKSRQKRWLPRFPFNSCYALAVVLALPLELKGRNVFFSYNFETNYYFPYFDNVQGIVPIPFATIDQDGTNLGTLNTNNTPLDEVRSLDKESETTDTNTTSSDVSLSLKNENIANEGSTTNSTETNQPLNKAGINKQENDSANISTNEESTKRTGRRKSRAILEHLMTRARLYKMMESKMNGFGMNGRKCLQKAICDISSNPINEHNGLIGDIVHIIFTPSTSKDEHLPRDLIEAELRGKTNNCDVYAKLCPTSILDLISTYF